MHGCNNLTHKTMHFLFILTLLCSSNFAERVLEEPQVSEITSRQNASIEQKPSKYRVSTYIYFSKSLPNNTRKVENNDLKLKCEVVVNVSKVELQVSRDHSVNNTESEEIVISKAPAHLIDNVTKTIKMNWMKNNVLIVPDELRISIKRTTSNGLASSVLRIRKLTKIDEGIYTCSAISGYYVINTTTKLLISENQRREKEGEIPLYKSLYPATGKELPTTLTSDETVHLSADGETPFFTEIVDSNKNKATTTPIESVVPKVIEPICQIYEGITCTQHLQGQYVYIPQQTTQVKLEEKINIAFKVVSYSNDISSNCEGYALPSLCYSTFPICRNPVSTNEQFFQEVNKTQFLSNSRGENLKDIDYDEPLNIQFENLPPSGLPAHLDPTKSNDIKKESRVAHNRARRFDKFKIKIDTRSKAVQTEMLPQFDRMVQESVKDSDPWHNTVHLRRVCRQDCEILENELCQKEYAIAKRHPHIGQQLSLEECENLPESDPDCLAIGVDTVMDADDQCYWENGVAYLGKVDMAKSGLPCIRWSQQMAQKLTNYPELAGGHSYCRNPGGIENQPWCFVEKDSKNERQLCEIPKCAHKIWIYIICVFAGLLVIFLALFVCLCCRNRNKHNPTTIRNINLPNADKNIYGNSRLNSPVEMNDLLQNQNSNLGPHGRNTRGNGVLRVPQYSLSQIKFLEELGEGAFGKVYKGALNKGNETTYVAVKALKENASAKTQADFRREIDLISELRHDNIVCIVGVALREEPLCMLFEFMARGDLHEFLMGRAPPAGRGLPASRLLSIAHHIACGMQYLAAHHYVHRDLAARNCLVGDDFVVKISDFGLSRDIYSSDYYRVQSKSLLPVRWMPPESILYGKFTTESDIWSYGVVLWEIYSYGLQPYYGFSNQEVISRVRGGELLACPCSCPAPVYALMRECWRHQGARRPHFDEISERLQTWVQSGTCEAVSSESSATSSAQRPALSVGDPRERVPLLPPHCSSSNGSLATTSVRKLSIAGSSSSNNKLLDDNCSTSSEIPPSVPRHKKGSCGSLIDSDRQSIKDTVVRLQTNTPNPHDI